MANGTTRMLRRMAKSAAARYATDLDPSQMGFFDADELRTATKAERAELERMMLAWAERLRK